LRLSVLASLERRRQAPGGVEGVCKTELALRTFIRSRTRARGTAMLR
jgi:hypothetical protein